jgi:nuclear protein localization protein 4 homolog
MSSPLFTGVGTNMLLRVRSNVGVWRVEVADQIALVQDILMGIQESRPHVVYEKPLSADPACLQPLDATVPLVAQGITHGSMIHCRVDPATTVDVTVASVAAGTSETEESDAIELPTKYTNMRRVIAKDGTIKLVPSGETSSAPDKGFRKGMLALRDMKMHWTCEFMV